MAELAGRRGRRHRQLLGDVKEGRSYEELKEEKLARTLWRTLREEVINLS
jgi:hypothetical protein